jgi:predicted Fe-Mo cluster-binding NifX family protein
MARRRGRLEATEGGGLEVYRNEEVIQGRGHRWEEILQLKPDVVITREIGRPAYHAFRAKGVKILLAEGATAREALEKWRRGKLREFLQSLYTSLDTATTEPIDASADGALCTCIEHPCRGYIRADLFSRCSSQATCLTPAAFGETWLTSAEPPSGRR